MDQPFGGDAYDFYCSKTVGGVNVSIYCGIKKCFDVKISEHYCRGSRPDFMLELISKLLSHNPPKQLIKNAYQVPDQLQSIYPNLRAFQFPGCI